jgi:hypothetical protein
LQLDVVRRFHLPNVADKPDTLARDRPDQALLVPAVADCFAHRVDMAGQSRLGDDSPVPHRVEQVVLADDALAVPHQEKQQVEDLWPDRNRAGLPHEFPPVGIERAISDYVLHFESPRPSTHPGVRRGLHSPGKPLIAQGSPAAHARHLRCL